jgi:hypothetical protein
MEMYMKRRWSTDRPGAHSRRYLGMKKNLRQNGSFSLAAYVKKVSDTMRQDARETEMQAG